MKKISAISAAILGAALLVTPAAAEGKNTNQTLPSEVKFAQEYGKSLPPVGYVAFCGRGEEECQLHGGKVERVKLTPENWDQLNEVNAYVNTKIRPATDLEVYGVPEYWAYPVDAGDCEDYALLKKRYLAGLGFAADELLMTVLLDEKGEGHAVLTVMTDQGDFILDNRRGEILRWDQTNYKFLKRQSQPDPRSWVSLQRNTTQVLTTSNSN